jgi:hypothetical protein
MREELLRDTLYIGLRTSKGLFRIGTFSLLIERRDAGIKKIYEFDIDEMRYKQACQMTDKIIPGFDPDYGWKQRHDKEMQFVYERTFHPKRVDLEEVLKPFGMRAAEYDKWQFLKKSKGVGIQDDWGLTDDINETY